MKKNILLSTLWIVLSAVGFVPVKAQTINLFNGSNLDGWGFVLRDNTKKPEEVFQVQDGVIHITGNPFGYMYTVEKYDNYRLHVEWRWPEEATNSGIFLHVQDDKKVWPNAIECQLKAGDAGDFVLLSGSDLAEFVSPEGETRPAFPVIKKKEDSSEMPAGEWNKADIISEDGNIRVYINGVLQNKGTKSLHTSGHIALQSEGKDIQFRNVKLVPNPFIVQFDPNKEISGKKFAVHDIAPDLPRNWDEYSYVVLEFWITTTQRFHVGFTTDYGYNELRVMSYTPNAWNRLAIPLKFYRRLPDARIDLAATYNQPRYTGWINLGGRRGELHGVDSIGIRMRRPIGTPELEIRTVALAVDDPGDAYLGEIPAIDEFGQHNLVDYPGKIHSLEQLQAEWNAEDREIETSVPGYNYSRYGGYLQKQVEGAGFFRIEKIDGRWWFVDPDGYLFLSHGVDCVSPGGGGNVRDIEKREGMFKQLPPEELSQQNNRGRRTASFGTWNLYRRYGEDFREQANEMVIQRMDRWGLNTIANWSSAAVYGLNRKAYTLQLRDLGMDGNLMGLADVYAPGFVVQMDSAMRTYLPAERDNPWVIGYFVGNEPSWLGQEVRLCDLILEGEDRPIQAELKKFLQRGDTPERKKEFIYKTFRIFLQTVKNTMRRYDPNHLNLGIRFGNLNELDETLMEICSNAFDILSFNCYALAPGNEMMDRALRLTDMPMIIGEFHFGTVDRGLAQSLWQVNSQQERGVAYRYYTEQAYAHPGLIGTAYFQWCDQDLMGRMDGENYNCGLVDVTDRPHKYQVEAMMETAKRLYAVHAGEIQPFDQIPLNARGHEGFPDEQP